MGMEIVTGYAGVSHITSKHDAVINASTLPTSGKYVIKNLMDGLSAELISGNTIRIGSGFAFNQGRLMGIDNYDAEDVTIAGGTSGTKRADLIVIRYQKDSSTGIETASLVVIQGTEGATYVDPDYYNNDLLNEDSSVDDMPLYRVKLDGLTIDSIEPIFSRWYLDTGWREDLVTTTLEEFVSGSDSQPAIRAIGNQVFFRSGYKLATASESGNYVIPEEYAPENNMHWTTCEYKTIYESQGGSAINKQLRFVNHSMVNNVISVEANYYGGTGTGYVEPWTIDSTNIYWFLD